MLSIINFRHVCMIVCMYYDGTYIRIVGAGVGMYVQYNSIVHKMCNLAYIMCKNLNCDGVLLIGCTVCRVPTASSVWQRAAQRGRSICRLCKMRYFEFIISVSNVCEICG